MRVRKLRTTTTCVLFVAFVLGTWLAACQADPGRKRRQAGAVQSFSMDGLTGGELLFEDGFEGTKLGDGWNPHPRARLVEGWLHIEKNRNEPPIWTTQALPEKVRVEFDARARSDEGDIKFEVFGDGEAHQSGYIVVFGAHNNSEDWFARLDEHGPDRITRATVGVEKDRVYHFALVRTDSQVRCFVDGNPFLMFEDPDPLVGTGHQFFAFNTWDSPLEFDNVKVFDLSK